MNRILFNPDDNQDNNRQNNQNNQNYDSRFNSNYVNNPNYLNNNMSDFSNNEKNDRHRNNYFIKNKTKKIVRLYAIILIIIGIVLISKSVLTISFSTRKKVEAPQVSVNQMGREVEVDVKAT